MYRRLLFSAGGGIISPVHQAEQAEDATILIGLGGTGIDCLRGLKKGIYNRLRPDDPSATVPAYSHIKFLAVDTDTCCLRDDGNIGSLDPNTEFLDLNCSDLRALVNCADFLRSTSSLQWFRASATQPDGTGINIPSANADASVVRQIGRLLLFLRCGAFIEKLTGLITSAMAGLPSTAELSIHIFTGMSGGTGAGTFLDVCYLVQYVLSNLGFLGKAQTCGYFFLPDVNLAKVSEADHSTQKYIKGNGFASMQELDYCMNLEVHGGFWEQDYGNGVVIRTQNPPVKMAHLISARNSDDPVSKDAYHHALYTAVERVMMYLVHPKISEEMNEIYSWRSELCQLYNHIRMVPKEHGACYNYGVLGASCAYVPYREITTYLTAKIFEGFQDLNHQQPTEADLDGFLQTNALRYEDILKSLNDRVPVVPMYVVDKGMLYQQVQGLTPDMTPPLFTQMRNSISKIHGQLTANQKALLEVAEDAQMEEGKRIVSLIGRVKKSLMQIAADPAKGPFYAAAMLHSHGAKDLSYWMDGFMKRSCQNLEQAVADMQVLEMNLADALRRLQNSNLLNRKRCAEEYTWAVRSYYKQIAKIHSYTVLREVLAEFRHQLSQLHSQFFGVFEKVMERLQATFQENLRTLAQPVTQQTSYAIQLVTIQDLKQSLDSWVAAMQMDTLIHGFVSQMLQHPEIWQAQDGDKISCGVSDYFLGQLQEFTHRGMNDYLQIKFNTVNPATISLAVHHNILQSLSQVSKPLFWEDTSKYDLDTAYAQEFCLVPEDSREVLEAAEHYREGHPETAICPSYSSDRITFLQVRYAVPLFGYKGVSIYRTDRHFSGAYLYEGAAGDSRDWRNLFDIIPYSCRTEQEIGPELRERMEIVREAAGRGIWEKRLLSSLDVEFCIHIYDREAMRALVKEAEEVLAIQDAKKAQALLEHLQCSPPRPVSQRVMENSGARGFEEQVNLDLIVSSQGLSQLLSDQVNAWREYDTAVDSLKRYIAQEKRWAEDLHTFANALCVGVITMEDDYTFTYRSEGGDSLTITILDSKPYGESLPLYSAFVNFSQMSQEDKNAIRQDVKDRKVDQREKVAEALTETKALIVPERLQAMAKRAKSSFPAEAEEIVKFLCELAKEIESISSV